MNNFKQLRVMLLTSLIAISFMILSGCSSMNVEEYLPDKKVEYKKSEKVGTDLEVPPDLTNVRAGSELYVPAATSGAGVATYSQFLGEKNIAKRGVLTNSNIMPKVDNISLKKEGAERWLVVQSSPQIVWPNVVSFWQDNGILLLEQDPTVGVMKTGWLENRADIANDFVTDSIRKLFDGIYSSATRDQYRVRLEEGDEAGTTEIYLTHFGMEETFEKSAGSGDADRTFWVGRGSDPGLEAEMLRRLMVHMGVEKQRAQALVSTKIKQRANRSTLIRNSREARLAIDETFAKSWRLTGLALDRVGFAVEDRDRSSGVYYVRYNDPMADVDTDDGWLSKLNFWAGSSKEELENRFQISIQSGSGKTDVVVLNEAGKQLATETAVRILTLIHEQIK